MKALLSRLFNRRTPSEFDFSRFKAAIEVDFENILETVAGDAKGSGYSREVENFRAQAIDYFSNYAYQLNGRIEDFSGTRGVDFGVYLGFSSLFLARMGAKHVTGVDVNSEFVEFARLWSSRLGVSNLDFALVEPTAERAIPVDSASLDWVIAHQTLDAVRPERFAEIYREFARVLKPGGYLFLLDGNNPHHQSTRERLLHNNWRYEIGEGTESEPSGAFHLARCKFIEESITGLSGEQVRQLARDTAYLAGGEILEHIHKVMDSKHVEPSRFDSLSLRPVVHPTEAFAVGSTTDPMQMMPELTRQGLPCTIEFGPGASVPATSDPTVEMLREYAQFFITARREGEQI